jgi:ATP-dependent DNA ligase
MLASDLRDLPKAGQDRIWASPEWIAEEKLNGIRVLCHIGSSENRLSTRVKSKRTGLYSEKTDHFPHLRDLPLDFLEGTILDGELLLDKTRLFTGTTWAQGSLSCTMALVNAAPQLAIALQQREGWATLQAFDIIRDRGEYIQGLPFSQRRSRLERIFHELAGRGIDLGHLKLVRQESACKATFYGSLVVRGGEGVMLKHRAGLYQHAGRSKQILKAKRSLTVDGFIIGSTPGKNGNAGLIGSLLIGVHDVATGQVREIAGVPPYDLSRGPRGSNLRREMSILKDGKPELAPAFLNRVVEVEAFCWNKNQRLVHAKIARFREDKALAECAVEFPGQRIPE